MSDNDLEESHQDVCFDSESEPPGFSSVDLAEIQGVNVCSPFSTKPKIEPLLNVGISPQYNQPPTRPIR